MAARGISIHKYPVHFFLGCVAPHPLQNADSKRRWQPTNIRKKRYKTFLFETKRKRLRGEERRREGLKEIGAGFYLCERFEVPLLGHQAKFIISAAIIVLYIHSFYPKTALEV